MTVHTLKSMGVQAPRRARVVALLAMVALSAVATGWLLDGVREGGDLSLWDGPTLSWLVAHRDSVATMTMTTVTTIAGEVVLTAIAALTVLLLAVRRHRVEAFLLAVALGSAETISLVLKHLVGRVRPPAGDVVGPVEHTLSFPSGHTIGMATFTLALAYLWWRARPGRKRAWAGWGVAVVLTSLVATSRLYLGDHWLTDVVASIVLSWGVMAVVVLLDIWIQQRTGQKRWLDGGVKVSVARLRRKAVPLAD
ncbi:phosphatase PAP2 family protein [Demequina lutea]|uniref:Undecaprenyl-diphosphatase n=1 Tax=Demequina lutea TaxID=431489 RepID=A0A7Y9Z9I1_9MICO|nr:phosphatase PAP2 family protein [Demequina lutea]NYI41287.1 undecaprenyl-diphosphatase [Demequina lutea]